MMMPGLKQEPHYTYADYLSWGEDERIELHDGKAVMMSPPSRKHQRITGEVFRQISNYLKEKKCEVYIAPFAVRLFEKDDDTPDQVKTVFEPDISIICDKNKLDDRGCKGAPDMVVEILSPSTAKYDMFLKRSNYQQAGVKEYWVISPKEELVYVSYLENGEYGTPEVYTAKDTVKIKVLEDCSIRLAEVFAD